MIDDADGAHRTKNAYPEELTIQRKVFAITGISIFVQVVHVVHILRADRV
jgi:hypothetical protein